MKLIFGYFSEAVQGKKKKGSGKDDNEEDKYKPPPVPFSSLVSIR